MPEYSFRLSTRNSSREDFLRARPCIIPEWMGEVVICGQSLIVTDKLLAILINRGINQLKG